MSPTSSSGHIAIGLTDMNKVASLYPKDKNFFIKGLGEIRMEEKTYYELVSKKITIKTSPCHEKIIQNIINNGDKEKTYSLMNPYGNTCAGFVDDVLQKIGIMTSPLAPTRLRFISPAALYYSLKIMGY